MNKKSIKKHKVIALLIIILASSLFWRFINYENRWVFSQDQARDVIIALYALENKIVPLIGPPSSAGPFSFGPLYYWVIMFFSLFFRLNNLSPWIGFTLLSALSVVLMFLLGLKMHGLVFASLMGFLAAFSTAHIANAPNILNPILISFAVSLIFYAIHRLFESKKVFFGLILGLSLGFAINLHFQSLGLMAIPLVIAALVKATFKKKMELFASISLGFLVTLVPILIFDFQNKGVWFTSAVNYFLYGQNRYYIPVRWLTDIFIFWPRLWGEVLTGIPVSGYLFVGLFLVAALLTVLKSNRFSKTWVVLIVAFMVEVLLVRYYKGGRLPLYLIVTHQFFIFFTAWSVFVYWQTKKILGIALLFIILLASTYSNMKIVNVPERVIPTKSIKLELDEKVTSKMELYQDKDSRLLGLLLFYFLYTDGKISNKGYPIGVCDLSNSKKDKCFNGKIIVRYGNYLVYDLKSATNSLQQEKNFEKYDDKEVYNSLFLNFPHLMR